VSRPAFDLIRVTSGYNMLSLASVLLGVCLLSQRTLAAPASSQCKCIAGQSCWPTASDWASLSKTLTHPVFDVHPAGFHCHDPHYNAQLCDIALGNSTDPDWRITQPGAVEPDQWERTNTSFCFINTNRTQPCGQGRVPAVGVNVTTVSDVVNSIKFAAERNLKVHVKNTG
jgi:hypothetical protein